MQKSGHISINTENILPIIKKWLYDDKDIFVRELISNATDAITKLQKITLTDEPSKDPGSPKVSIKIDKDKKQLIIEDNGIGMNADEIEKYINQVAFSGMQDFVDQYKSDNEQNQIIGHFGLGFYSAFMVSDKVEIETLSYRKGEKAVHWSCDGSTEFQIKSSDKDTIGTRIILHINKESEEFLEEAHLKEVLEKYCRFMKYPVNFEEATLNTPTPLWSKSPSELKDEDYIKFYQELFPTENNPLFWIHINFDYPFNLRGIVFFPDISNATNLQEGNIKLFCNQVYVTEHCKEVVPEFLGFLQGALECPDIPLNVSRSALNKDPLVRKIRDHLAKKILDKIVGFEKTDRKKFEGDWQKLGSFVKFAMLNDKIYSDKLKNHVLLEATTGDFYNIKELKEKLGEDAKEVVYCTSKQAQASYIKSYEDAKIPVIVLDQMVDTHFISQLESDSEIGLTFQGVDSQKISHLIDTDASSDVIVDAKDSKNKNEKLTESFQKHLNPSIEIKVEALKTPDIPAMLMEDETMRRYKEMAKMNSGGMDMSKISEMLNAKQTLLINKNNPAIQKILTKISGVQPDLETEELMVKYVYDLARIQQGSLDQNAMVEFVGRSTKVLEKIT